MTKPIEDSTNAEAIRTALDVPTTAALNAKYTKPSNGIPATDLDADPAGRVLLTATSASERKQVLGLDQVNNTSDASKPISTATQTALDGKMSATLPALQTVFDSGTAPQKAAFQASVSEYHAPAGWALDLATPGIDYEAEAVADQIGMTSTHGRQLTIYLVKVLKKLGVYSSLANGFLIGTDFQSGSVQKSLRLGGTSATTVSAPGLTAFGATVGGNNGYTYPNPTLTTAGNGRTIFALYRDSNFSTSHTSHVLSNYAGGTNKGPAILSGGTSFTSTNTANDIFGQINIDGNANAELRCNDCHDGFASLVALRHGDGRSSLHVYNQPAVSAALATYWANYATMGVGIAGGTGSGLVGTMYAVLDFGAALSSEQIDGVMHALRYILAQYIEPRRQLVWVGNSLTEAAPGGGTNWPTKLLAKPAWSAVYSGVNSRNLALSGSRVCGHNDAIARAYAESMRPIAGESNKAFVWSGINDITAGLSAAQVCAGLDRVCWRLLERGFRVRLLNLSPVASVGDGTAYQYTPAQQAVRTAVNDWIAQQYLYRPIDLLQIGGDFLNPLSGDYVSGDGLHHSDQGRQNIADLVASVETP